MPVATFLRPGLPGYTPADQRSSTRAQPKALAAIAIPSHAMPSAIRLSRPEGSPTASQREASSQSSICWPTHAERWCSPPCICCCDDAARGARCPRRRWKARARGPSIHLEEQKQISTHPKRVALFALRRFASTKLHANNEWGSRDGIQVCLECHVRVHTCAECLRRS